MKAYCPQCGAWTEDDWTDGPFGVCCWTCRHSYLALGRALMGDEGLMSAVGRMLARAYGRQGAPEPPGTVTRGTLPH